MDRRMMLQALGAVAMMPMVAGMDARGEDQDTGTVFELRIYHTYEGKLEPLLARFRGGETKLFAKHGMTAVGYWTPTEEPLKGRTLIYLLKHKSREAAAASWKAFSSDPEWVKMKAESEKDGAFVEKHDVTFMALTDFSPKL